MGLTTIFVIASFNTQPPEGGCVRRRRRIRHPHRFNTQPPEGGCKVTVPMQPRAVCFNTQPPEGGCPGRPNPAFDAFMCVSTHSRPKAAAAAAMPAARGELGFQHTAARRRLRANASHAGDARYVSTHSRPKAAALPTVVVMP